MTAGWLRERVQYHLPWQVARWGFGFKPVSRGSDEWGNRSVDVIVPLLGRLVAFTGSNLWGGPFDRSGWFHHGYVDRHSNWTSPDYRFEATLPDPTDLPADRFTIDWTDPRFPLIAPVDEETVRAYAYTIEPTDLYPVDGDQVQP